MSGLWLGIHKLLIELGRYNQLRRDRRLCPICKCNEIEDEPHFLFHCEGYSALGKKLYDKIVSFANLKTFINHRNFS